MVPSQVPTGVQQYRTMPLDRSVLLEELVAVCEVWNAANVEDVVVSFGWESNLTIDEMWKSQIVSIDRLLAFIADSEASGIVKIGGADIFVEAAGLVFTLCHESDAHVEGNPELVKPFVERWSALGYAPYQCAL